MRDFRDEIPGYLNNYRICEELSALELSGGVESLGDDLRKCYQKLVELGEIGTNELPLVDAWLEDVANLG